MSTPDFLTDSCSPVVAVAGELAASSAAVGRVNAQEKVGCWCTTVEGIEAEVKAAGFTENKVLQLLKGCFWVLPHCVAGGCTAGSIARRLYPLRPAAFVSALRALAEEDALTRAVLVRVSVSVSPWCLLKGCVQRVRMRPGEHGGRSNDRSDTCQ